MTGQFSAWLRCAAGTAALAVIIGGAPAGAADHLADVGKIVQAVVREAGIQTNSPRSDEAPKALPAPATAASAPALTKLTGTLGRMIGQVLVALLAIVLLVLIGWGVISLARRSRPPPIAATAAPLPDPPTAAAEALNPDEPERLAQHGDFGGAIHLLLLRAVGGLERGDVARLPRSLTSREVLRHAQLAGEAGAALAGLVAAVEASHFGGAPADEATYRQCRERYRLVAAAAP